MTFTDFSVDQAISNKFLGYSVLLFEEPSSSLCYAVCRIKQSFLACLGFLHLLAFHFLLFGRSVLARHIAVSLGWDLESPKNSPPAPKTTTTTPK